MSYTASKISTTDSTESLVTALCKVSPVMGMPASKQRRIYTKDIMAVQSLSTLCSIAIPVVATVIVGLHWL